MLSAMLRTPITAPMPPCLPSPAANAVSAGCARAPMLPATALMSSKSQKSRANRIVMNAPETSQPLSTISRRLLDRSAKRPNGTWSKLFTNI